ncbi:MAG: tetratricopeptide repeat protein [Candidatus Sumerlaeaceae bacterium]
MADQENDTQPENETSGGFAVPQGYRYNLDSLEEYLATGERIANEGRLDEAVDLMREATQRYPDSPTGRYNLGVALFLRLREDKQHLDLWEDLADDEQLADEAMVSLEAAIERDGGFIQAYNNLARIYALRGRSDDAIRTWERSLSIQPDQPTVQAEMELYLSRMGPTDRDKEEKRTLDEEQPPIGE